MQNIANIHLIVITCILTGKKRIPSYIPQAQPQVRTTTQSYFLI